MKAILRLVAAGCLAGTLLLAGCDFSAIAPEAPRASVKLLPVDSLMALPNLPVPTGVDTTGYYADHDTTGGG